MNVNIKTLARRATTLVALGAAVGLNIAQAQPQGLSAQVVAAERFRAVQEGAAAIKLLTAATALPQTTGRAPAVSDIAADKRAPGGDSVAADKRVPGGDSIAADKRVPGGDSIAADKRVPGGDSVAADKRAPGGDSIAADRRVKCCD